MPHDYKITGCLLGFVGDMPMGEPMPIGDPLGDGTSSDFGE